MGTALTRCKCQGRTLLSEDIHVLNSWNGAWYTSLAIQFWGYPTKLTDILTYSGFDHIFRFEDFCLHFPNQTYVMKSKYIHIGCDNCIDIIMFYLSVEYFTQQTDLQQNILVRYNNAYLLSWNDYSHPRWSNTDLATNHNEGGYFQCLTPHSHVTILIAAAVCVGGS